MILRLSPLRPIAESPEPHPAGIASFSYGDPKRIAAVVVKLANTQDVPKRLILGKDAETRVKDAETQRAEETAKYRELTLATVFPDARRSRVC